MQLKYLKLFAQVLSLFILMYIAYHYSYSHCFRIAYRHGETALEEWKAWVVTMERKVYAKFSQESPGETIVCESDVPIFLLNSDCFTTLTRKEPKRLRKLLSEKDLIDYLHFLEVKNKYIVENYNFDWSKP